LNHFEKGDFFVDSSLDTKFHELLLGVLWDGVVHTSASIRSSSARMFEVGFIALWSHIDRHLISVAHTCH
jgi:hypothetical protein